MGDVNALEFVGVDWGTSTFRAWYCKSGEAPVQIHKSVMGMSKLRRNEFAPYLEKILSNKGISYSAPVIICGMAGAREGWREVPYVSVPACLEDIINNAAHVTAGRYGCTILPGVCIAEEERFDVMRGEETLLFGAISNGVRDGIFCLPGTHSKWCRIECGSLVSWQTVMTGELFALLSTTSTLSQFCGSIRSELFDKTVFRNAVHEVLAQPTSAIHKLFSIRARALLDPEADIYDFSSRLSGLLIGQEIAGVQLEESDPVFLIASGPIREAYSSAIKISGSEVVTIAADTSAIAGLSLFAHELLKTNKVASRAQ